VTAVNAQAAALKTIFALPAATAATFQKLIMAAVAELLIVAAFLTAEWLRVEPTTPRPKPMPASVPMVVNKPKEKRRSERLVKPAVPKPVQLIAIDAAAGEVAAFAKACLEPNQEGQAIVAELYEPYRRWCKQEHLHAYEQGEFEGRFAVERSEVGKSPGDRPSAVYR
jgi:hypothetical protein